jgi:hypothetical protein
MYGAVLILMLAVCAFCAGCQQHWTFAPPGQVGSRFRPRVEPRDNAAALPYSGIVPPDSESKVVAASATVPVEPDPPASGPAIEPQPLPSEEIPWPGESNAVGNWLVEPVDAPPVTGPIELPPPVWQEEFDPLCVPTDGARPYDEAMALRPRVSDRLALAWHNIKQDHINFYSWRTFSDLAVGLGGAAVLANTSLDQDFCDWYQDDVRSAGTNNFASFWKTFGDGHIFIPAFAGMAVVGRFMDHYPTTYIAGEYGSRVTRSYLVGFPSVLFLQTALGPSRPSEPNPHSSWRPFSDCHGVSGHAFMGSIPFITAARMTENPWIAGTLYVCSTFTAWSRINDNQHYLSQAILGWWMGYLASRAVSDTQTQDQAVSFAPLVTEQGVGVMVMCRL